MQPRAVLLIAAALVLGSCGGDGEDPAAPTSGAGAQLTITVRADPGADPRTTEVSCAEGDTAPPCPTALALTPADFAAPPADRACTQIYGGPQQATIEGTVDGEPVRATVTRADGCEIDRWDTVVAPLTGS